MRLNCNKFDESLPPSIHFAIVQSRHSPRTHQHYQSTEKLAFVHLASCFIKLRSYLRDVTFLLFKPKIRQNVRILLIFLRRIFSCHALLYPPPVLSVSIHSQSPVCHSTQSLFCNHHPRGIRITYQATTIHPRFPSEIILSSSSSSSTKSAGEA